MPSFTLSVSHRRPLDLSTRATMDTLPAKLSQLLASPDAYNVDALYLSADASATVAGQRAHGLLTLSSGSGSVGADLNGVSVVDTWATSDTVSAGLIAAAINASTDALVKGFFGASAYSGTVTCSSVAVADWVEVFGQRFTATATATGKVGEFAQSGTNAQDATALAAAINAHPALVGRCRAVAVSAVVYVAPMRNSAALSNEKLLSSSSTTLAVSQVAARAAVMVWALLPGVVGNAFGFAASGTGVTATTLGTAKLGGGLGSNAIAGSTYFGVP